MRTLRRGGTIILLKFEKTETRIKPLNQSTYSTPWPHLTESNVSFQSTKMPSQYQLHGY